MTLAKAVGVLIEGDCKLLVNREVLSNVQVLAKNRHDEGGDWGDGRHGC